PRQLSIVLDDQKAHDMSAGCSCDRTAYTMALLSSIIRAASASEKSATLAALPCQIHVSRSRAHLQRTSRSHS
ncbi:hypothetical protein, partial [Bradyrhizobium guangdongense]|uniref:hypothetical protein n=1 Tax=Bradyrhizobium guangdongense TaxID=1325090 RepID=UPI001FD9874B